MKTKQAIRAEMLEALKHLPVHHRQAYNEEIEALVKASPEWEQAETIAVTLSRFLEVNTDAIIQAAFSAGKRVVIPYSGKDRKLSFYNYDKGVELEESSFGLLEPKNRETEILKTDIDLIIVPGLAYSPQGYRVGFGGGYYDRYLADYRGRTASILYPFQLRPEVESMVESFDVPIQKLFIPIK